jgi:hypothetical protein
LEKHCGEVDLDIAIALVVIRLVPALLSGTSKSVLGFEYPNTRDI